MVELARGLHPDIVKPADPRCEQKMAESGNFYMPWLPDGGE